MSGGSPQDALRDTGPVGDSVAENPSSCSCVQVVDESVPPPGSERPNSRAPVSPIAFAKPCLESEPAGLAELCQLEAVRGREEQSARDGASQLGIWNATDELLVPLECGGGEPPNLSMRTVGPKEMRTWSSRKRPSN